MKHLLGALILGTAGLFLFSCQEPATTPDAAANPIRSETIVLPQLAAYFEADSVDGAFFWYDLQNEQLYAFQPQPDRIDTRYPPASTFKILNALIALETGVIGDTSETIPWDGVERGWNRWDRDQTLGTGLKYSALWAYREVARRVYQQDTGAYRRILQEVGYGNQTHGPEIDLFWLDNSLQITPREQIDFLVRLYQNELPFQPQHLAAVKHMMLVKQNERYRLRGKTGWAILDQQNWAWYVGYVETAENVYVFCTQLGKKGTIASDGSFRGTYMNLTYQLVDDLLAGKVEGYPFP